MTTWLALLIWICAALNVWLVIAPNIKLPLLTDIGCAMSAFGLVGLMAACDGGCKVSDVPTVPIGLQVVGLLLAGIGWLRHARRQGAR